MEDIDGLAMFALFALFFGFLSAMIVGGAIGGGIAGALAWGVHNWLPEDDNGRRLPPVISIVIILMGIGMFVAPYVLA